MRKQKKSVLEDKDEVDLTPMIDIVFMLLFYFMVTADLEVEADINLRLPESAKTQRENLDLPNEHIVEIMPSGVIKLNGAVMDYYDSRDMPELVTRLQRLKASADVAGKKTAVIIIADSASLHQRSIDVLNACSKAKIKLVSFSTE